jgi:cell division protease FtsH
LSYYDSTGQAYGFTKPYSDERAHIIDQEVSRIIAEQYERAKAILREHAEGHKKLADVLITREVIFTDDVVAIFGPRPWVSRTEEILADRQAKDDADKLLEAEKSEHPDDNDVDNDSNANISDVEAKEVNDDEPTPPPMPKA